MVDHDDVTFIKVELEAGPNRTYSLEEPVTDTGLAPHQKKFLEAADEYRIEMMKRWRKV